MLATEPDSKVREHERSTVVNGETYRCFTRPGDTAVYVQDPAGRNHRVIFNADEWTRETARVGADEYVKHGMEWRVLHRYGDGRWTWRHPDEYPDAEMGRHFANLALVRAADNWRDLRIRELRAASEKHEVPPWWRSYGMRRHGAYR